MYLVFVVFFGIKLQAWDDDREGACYLTGWTSTSTAVHPYVDTIYLAVSCLFFFFSLSVCVEIASRAFQRRFRDIYNQEAKRGRLNWLFLRILKFNLDILSSFDGGIRVMVTDIADKYSWRLDDRTSRIFLRYLDVLGFVDTGKLQISELELQLFSLALLQYPLHSYFMFAIRAANMGELSGDSENAWGFGQVVALVLLGSSVLGCIQAIYCVFDIPHP